MSAGVPRRAVLSAFARSFLIQGSWNYHTMIGSGFAFAMLPGLRRIFAGSPERMAASIRRHLELFNAHPYLSGVALGAALRLEADGADEETVRRFKAAVRGPLGSLGDTLVWAAWLPGVSTAALALFWLGVPPTGVIAFFLIVYNLGHVALRAWGFRVGLSDGREVGRSLARANLTRLSTSLQPIVVALLGVLVGSALGGGGGLAEAGAPWVALGAAAFVVGLVVGHRAWRPAAAAVVACVVLLSAVGVLG